MPLFVCDECGCVDNTALGHYWTRGKYGTPKEALCTECMPEEYDKGLKGSRYGKWHDRFPKEKYVPGKFGVLNR